MVEVCIKFVLGIHHHSLAILDSIITMDKTTICYHTSKKKEQSQQWIKKGQQGPIKAKVNANQTKEMLLAFFDNKGLIYLHIIPRAPLSMQPTSSRSWASL
jgi:predicted HAD superfamily phosphohydrolase YqeG